MAVQIRCFHCDCQFLMRSANTHWALEILPIRQMKIRIECPHCGGSNHEFIESINPKFGAPVSPSEFKDELFESTANREVYEFYKGYLPNDWPNGGLTGINIYDESGGVIGSVSGGIEALGIKADDQSDHFEGIQKI